MLRLLLLICLATPALADPPDRLLTPQEFETQFTGRTFAYDDQGTVWGIETYLADRRVQWRAVGQDCKLGHWFPQGSAICFDYEDGTENQCWNFVQLGRGGMQAQFLNDPASPPAGMQELTDPVPCPGPEVGS